jgi:hypothetical protein
MSEVGVMFCCVSNPTHHKDRACESPLCHSQPRTSFNQRSAFLVRVFFSLVCGVLANFVSGAFQA